MAVDVKRAVELAEHYLADMFKISTSEMLLEEVERSSDGRYWLITLSYPSPIPVTNPIFAFSGRGDREYKVVKLLTETGDFESIKIRDLARTVA